MLTSPVSSGSGGAGGEQGTRHERQQGREDGREEGREQLRLNPLTRRVGSLPEAAIFLPSAAMACLYPGRGMVIRRVVGIEAGSFCDHEVPVWRR